MHVNQLLKNEESKKEKIKELGIDYNFPGFVNFFNEIIAIFSQL